MDGASLFFLRTGLAHETTSERIGTATYSARFSLNRTKEMALLLLWLCLLVATLTDGQPGEWISIVIVI